MEFVFELATQADDAAIRRLLRSIPMPGAVSVTYEREPNFFQSCATLGQCDIAIARHRPSGEVAAVICRSTRPLFVNGVEEEVGYLGQLRIDRRFRGRWLSIGSVPLLRKLHTDGRCQGYISTITEENHEARGILVDHPRRGFPHFHEVDRIVTLAQLVRRPQRLPALCELGPGSADELPDIVAFLRHEGARRQFFPAYTTADFGGPLTDGFRVEDFIVARRQGQIVGVIGLWDQSASKQTIVQGYNGSLRWLRPLAGLGLRLAGARPLPAPGRPLRSAYASFCAVAGDDPAIFSLLLQAAHNLAARRGLAFVLVGLAAGDPLLDHARRFLHIAYHSRLYAVHWKDQESFYERLDRRLAAIDLAAL